MKVKKGLKLGLAGVAAAYVLLLIPGPEPEIPATNPAKAFAWNQDARWLELEAQFDRARTAGCDSIGKMIERDIRIGEAMLVSLKRDNYAVADEIFGRLEMTTFETAALAGGCPEAANEFIGFITRLRGAVKKQSTGWDMKLPEARQRIYRLLYGARGAVEEVMLQAKEGAIEPLIRGTDEPSETPSAQALGITIHSGDILISRGGVATSALIARGNDYAGNFSHAALVDIDPATKLISILESHIERGVTISSLDKYLQDKKFRIMILRLRADLPEIKADPTHRRQTAVGLY